MSSVFFLNMQNNRWQNPDFETMLKMGVGSLIPNLTDIHAMFAVVFVTADPARKLPALRTAQPEILRNAKQRVELTKAALPRN